MEPSKLLLVVFTVIINGMTTFTIHLSLLIFNLLLTSCKIRFVLVSFASGTSIAKFPSSGIVVKKTLNDQRYEVTAGKTRSSLDAPILGLYQTTSEDGGRLVLYGDSNCLDAAPLQRGKVDNLETKNRDFSWV